jgi:hypothetical protein
VGHEDEAISPEEEAEYAADAEEEEEDGFRSSRESVSDDDAEEDEDQDPHQTITSTSKTPKSWQSEPAPRHANKLPQQEPAPASSWSTNYIE